MRISLVRGDLSKLLSPPSDAWYLGYASLPSAVARGLIVNPETGALTVKQLEVLHKADEPSGLVVDVRLPTGQELTARFSKLPLGRVSELSCPAGDRRGLCFHVPWVGWSGAQWFDGSLEAFHEGVQVVSVPPGSLSIIHLNLEKSFSTPPRPSPSVQSVTDEGRDMLASLVAAARLLDSSLEINKRFILKLPMFDGFSVCALVAFRLAFPEAPILLKASEKWRSGSPRKLLRQLGVNLTLPGSPSPSQLGGQLVQLAKVIEGLPWMKVLAAANRHHLIVPDSLIQVLSTS